MRLSIAEIVEAVSGEFAAAPFDAEAEAFGLTWDSREADAGCVYVALPGERVNGHAFVAAAIRSGAVCALVAHEPDIDALDAARDAGAAIVKVADTQEALVDLARFWRSRLSGRLIGLTGSSGKTTTKNLVRDVLSAALLGIALGGRTAAIGATRHGKTRQSSGTASHRQEATTAHGIFRDLHDQCFLSSELSFTRNTGWIPCVC